DPATTTNARSTRRSAGTRHAYRSEHRDHDGAQRRLSRHPRQRGLHRLDHIAPEVAPAARGVSEEVGEEVACIANCVVSYLLTKAPLLFHLRRVLTYRLTGAGEGSDALQFLLR